MLLLFNDVNFRALVFQKKATHKCMTNAKEKSFLRNNLEDTSPFCGPLIPLSGLLVTSAMGFKAGVDPSLMCFIIWVQWIPQIHL